MLVLSLIFRLARQDFDFVARVGLQGAVYLAIMYTYFVGIGVLIRGGLWVAWKIAIGLRQPVELPPRPRRRKEPANLEHIANVIKPESTNAAIDGA